MARIARVVLPDTPHHITQRGVRSMDVFFSPEDYARYCTLLREQADRYGVKILSYCLMTNHVHLVAVPSDPETLSRAIGEAHRLYTRSVNFKQGARGYLFQGRFFSTPLDERHFFATLRYVEQNPLRAGIVKEPWEYRYSSARYLTGSTREDPLVSAHPLLERVTDWKTFLETPPEEIEVLREKTRTGRPCGDEAFYERIKAATGNDYTPKAPGRPKKVEK